MKILTKDVVRKIRGMHTIETIARILNVSKKKAIYYIYRLRKKGYVKTKYVSGKKRVYHISEANIAGGESYVDVINRHSPIKISTSQVYKVYGRKISPEEALIYAIKSGNLRTILVALALFKKIKNWKNLHLLAKKEGIVRETLALYDVARINIKKIRRIDLRIVRNIKAEKYKHIIKGLQSDDFKEIEKKWKIYIPFNKSDFQEYK